MLQRSVCLHRLCQYLLMTKIKFGNCLDYRLCQVKMCSTLLQSLDSIYSTYPSSKFNFPFCTASDHITSRIQPYPGRNTVTSVYNIYRDCRPPCTTLAMLPRVPTLLSKKGTICPRCLKAAGITFTCSIRRTYFVESS